MDTYFSVHRPPAGGQHPHAAMMGRTRRVLALLCVGVLAAAVAILELGATNPALVPIGLGMIVLAVTIDRRARRTASERARR